MSRPPKIDAFDFDVPDADVVAENKTYLTAVKKVIMDLRNSVKIKGTLAADLMALYGAVNNTTEIAAKFGHYAHPRYLERNTTCRFKTRNCCLLFDVVMLITHYQEHTGLTSVPYDKLDLDNKLKHINSILKHGLKAYSVVGGEREGYVLKRR